MDLGICFMPIVTAGRQSLAALSTPGGGGHNFFEPLVWGKPTFVGRFTRNWRAEVSESQSLGLLKVCEDHMELAVELQQLNEDYLRPSSREWFASRPRSSCQYADMLVGKLKVK